MIELTLQKIINATPQEVEAWGSFWKKIFFGIAAIVGAIHVPKAVSDYAVTVRVESIIQNTLSSITKIQNTQNINVFTTALKNSIDNPDAFKSLIQAAPYPLLYGLGLQEPKESLEAQIKGATTREELRNIVKDKFPSVLINENNQPPVSDDWYMNQSNPKKSGQQ
jgi:hypothetical protein